MNGDGRVRKNKLRSVAMGTSPWGRAKRMLCMYLCFGGSTTEASSLLDHLIHVLQSLQELVGRFGMDWNGLVVGWCVVLCCVVVVGEE